VRQTVEVEPLQRADIERWSAEERARVARLLDGFIDRPAVNRPPKIRFFVIALTLIGASVLIPWIAYLAASLPKTYSVRAWNVVWIGFDIALALCLAVTGWWVLQRRQVAMFGLIVTATLLCCDTWFDVCLAWNTSGQAAALLTATAVEVPVAAVLAVAAFRILGRSARFTRQLRGQASGNESIWQQRFVMLPPNP
jgi:hypothetical protein